ncbi:MAG: hypothetical protein HYZ17_09055 [Betaproteobacteria bacterium]|nr:hypothetical protein [Betaproteobacteria bacterium]
MSWGLSFLLALLTGIVSAIAAGFVAGGYANWYRVSNFEGAGGYMIIGVGLLGGLAGLIFGLVVARYGAAGEMGSFLRAASIALGSVAVIAAVAAGGGWLLAEHPPTLDGHELMLEVELRLPAGQAPAPEPQAGDFFVVEVVAGSELHGRQSGDFSRNAARLEGPRWIVPASAYLPSKRAGRVIHWRLGGIEAPRFQLDLPAKPDRSHLQWSEWGPRPPEGQTPWPDTEPSYRYRVQPLLPPPPPPSESEKQAAVLVEEERIIAAFGPDTPLRDWLPYLRTSAPQARVQTALAKLSARANFVDEAAALMRDTDPYRASETLHLLTQITPAPQTLVEPVRVYGAELGQRLREIVALSVEDDPGYHQAADFSLRFSAWRAAANHLRSVGGDFAPELETILKLSRQRDDSIVLRSDVRRVASYWLQQWKGTPPEPGDPPPR